MARTATLSGWGQPHDALNLLFHDATAIEYAQESSIEAALAVITAATKNAELVIGWSLGGQLAVRAIALGMLAPKHLILIASAYQFVAPKPGALGMGRDTFEKFRGNYARNPERTLHKGWELIIKGDSKPDTVRGYLEKQDMQAVQRYDWLGWLNRLDGFSFAGTDFSRFPPTLLIHGDGDAVVAHAQSEKFKDCLPQAQFFTCKGAGHAPHWHDVETIRSQIQKFAHV